MSEESLPQVQSVYAQQRDTKDWFIKKSYPKIKVELPLNISIILNNFKSFIKRVDEKVWTQNINKKKGTKQSLPSRNKPEDGQNT